MKKIAALIIAAISIFAVFSFSGCGNNGVSDNTLNKIKNSQSDKVDLAVWSKAFTSTDIYNSTAVHKSESNLTLVYDTTTTVFNSDSIVTVYNDFTCNNDVVTGNVYGLEESMSYYSNGDEYSYTNYNGSAYAIINETSLIQYAETADGSYTISKESSETGFGANDIMSEVYIHSEYSGGEFDGCAYADFTYDAELGSYVYEYTSGNYTYDYELKFSGGNLIYCKIYTYFYYKDTSSTSEITGSNEYYYIYDKVSVSIPNSVQKKIDSLSEN